MDKTEKSLIGRFPRHFLVECVMYIPFKCKGFRNVIIGTAESCAWKERDSKMGARRKSLLQATFPFQLSTTSRISNDQALLEISD